MSSIFIHGIGAVSPAGWDANALAAALKSKTSIEAKALQHPCRSEPLMVRSVPPPTTRPAFLAHPRLRRSSSISQYVVAAGLEALGEDVSAVQNGAMQLGIIVCVMTGSVAYSRRFYEEVLKDPATASPLIFPETVFNAPASHLAAYLNSTAINYTLVGDDGSFLQGLALAADWLLDQRVDACLVIGTEETDWIISDALRCFDRKAIHASGAGALLLKNTDSDRSVVELSHITDSFPFTQEQPFEAAARMTSQFTQYASGELLCHNTRIWPQENLANEAWNDWPGPRLETKSILGEAFTASTAWQCVAACHAIQHDGFTAANVSVVGANQQAIGARFVKSNQRNCPSP